jgi:signal transduction histidine kinase
MRDDVTWNSRVGKEYLGIISEECDKLMELIDNILEVSKIEVGVLRMYLETVQINQIIERAENEARQRFPELKLKLEILPEAETPYVMADPRRILQVLRNLLGNAVKYAPEGTPITIRVETKYISEANPDLPMVCISVQDKGIGLKSEDLDQVFERFYRVDNGPARMTEGTGLGLAICRGIIDAHNGRIWAESDGLGRGSKFLFTLPIVTLPDNVALD